MSSLYYTAAEKIALIRGMKSYLPFILHYESEIVRSKNPDKSADFYSKLAWEVESCKEAEKVFPDMLKCPVCLNVAEERGDDLVILHKASKFLRN